MSQALITRRGVSTSGPIDWAETDSSSKSYIVNKPDLSIYETKASASGTYQVKFTTGNGFQLSGDVLSPKLDGTTLSVGVNGIKGNYIGGTNVTISGNTISATDTKYSDATTTTSGLMSSADKIKMSGIASGADVSVQSNWVESNSSSKSYIANKPDLSIYETKASASGTYQVKFTTGNGFQLSGGVLSPKLDGTTLSVGVNGIKGNYIGGTNVTISGNTISATDTKYSDATTTTSGLMSSADKIKMSGIASGADVSVQSNWVESNSSSKSYIANKPILETVATTGNYNDLSNKPDLSVYESKLYTVTLEKSSWKENRGCFVQQSSASPNSLLGTDCVQADIVLNGNVAIARKELEEWYKVSMIEVKDSFVLVTCFDEVPAIDLNIQLKV